MELLRPYLSRNLRLSNPVSGALPEDIFLSSAKRMLEITRLYYSKYHDTSARCAIAWFIAPVYTTNLSLKGILPGISSEQRKQDFEMCMYAFMGLGMSSAMREQIIKSCMAMAVSNRLLTKAEARMMVERCFGVRRKGRISGRDDAAGAKMVIDMDRAAVSPNSSRVVDMAREFDYMALASDA